MKVYTAPAGVSCASCGYAIRFMPEADWKAGFAIGECSGARCENYKKPFRFPLQSVGVEFIGEGEEHF